jgi:hypothetical protein
MEDDVNRIWLWELEKKILFQCKFR